MLPIVDKEHNTMWCPYCPDKQPVYIVSRNNPQLGGEILSPELLAEVNSKTGKHYVIFEWCKKCSTVWLGEPKTENETWTGIDWDTWAQGSFGETGILGPKKLSNVRPLALAGFADMKKGRSYRIDQGEATKGRLVVTEDLGRTNPREKKGRFWSRSKGEANS